MKEKKWSGDHKVLWACAFYFTNPVVSHCSVSLVTAKDSQ